MTEEQWGKVYDLLVTELDASESLRFQFLQDYTTKDVTPPEYRVCRALGFGGKLRYREGRLYVDMYREDETPDLLKLRDSVNQKLADLVSLFTKAA
jgi:hypothetical protein